jgi:hypothetical protein
VKKLFKIIRKMFQEFVFLPTKILKAIHNG